MLVYLVLILALSIDTFIAAISYEGSKIKIPFLSNITISFICSFSLIISLIIGNIFENIININILKWLSFILLFSIGIIKTFNSHIKNFIKKEKLKQLNFSLGDLNFVIEIYGDYKKADLDKSKRLSIIESIYLGLVLSIDSLVSGIAFQTNFLFFIPIFILSIIINILAIYSAKIIRNINFDFSLISGFIFIILAFLKL